MKTVVGLFANHNDAERAVNALEDGGFDRSGFSVVTREGAIDTETEVYEETTDDPSGAGVGAGAGAVGGTVLGGLAGLLIGTGALLIPGVGPVIAAGSLATALGSTALGAGIGAGVGAVVGGLVGALVDMGIPEEEAHVYAEGVKRGGILVIAQTDDTRAPVAASIMQNNQALDVDTRREVWQAEGWEGFDPAVRPDNDYPRL